MRHTGQRRSQPAGSAPFALDPLESRRLLADTFAIAVIEYGGQQIEMVRGEWIVGLTNPGSTYNEETGRWEFNGIRNSSTTPSEALKLALAAAEEMGIEFNQYISSEDVFLVNVPDGMSYPQLLDVMDDLPEFRYVEPNFIARIGALPLIPDVPPEEAKTEEPVAEKPDVTAQPAVNRFVMPTQRAFGQDRIGGSDVLDAEDDDDNDDDLLK